jgi:hypothetical protein
VNTRHGWISARLLAPVLVLVVLMLAASPVLARPKGNLQLSGGNVDLTFGAPTADGMLPYVYLNSGTGTYKEKHPVVWTYDERGAYEMATLAQSLESLTYTVTRLHGKDQKPGKTVVLHVIPSSYHVTYEDPNSPNPCQKGTFTSLLVEGGSVSGTFTCVNGVPAAQMDFTIEKGSKAEAALDG